MQRHAQLLRRFLAFGIAGLLALFILLSVPDAEAQWSSNPDINTPVAVAINAQSTSVACSDGAGGAIIAWMDDGAGIGQTDIYAQRIDSAGNPLWGVNGVPICTAPWNQANPAITSDGAGGAIITWQDNRAPLPFGTQEDIWAQRVNADGDRLWTPALPADPANGVPVCVTGNLQIWPMLVSDGAGGAIITWEDNRGAAYDIYAQRVNGATGAVMWIVPPPAGPGLSICTAANNQLMPMIVSDGVGVGGGGAIITWYDARNAANWGIYAQRVSGAGGIMWGWAPNGVQLSGPATVGVVGQRLWPEITTDAPDGTIGARGAIVTWYDGRNGNWDIYAQHVTSVGGIAPGWVAGGVSICAEPSLNDQMYPKIAADGGGGAFITWQDLRSVDWNIFAQHVNGDATLPFPFIPDGFVVCVGTGGQTFPKIVRDGADGAIVAWNDSRSDPSDIYAQHLNADAIPQWLPPDGVAISTAPVNQDWQVQFMPMVEDGNGGAIITWNDWRAAGPPATPPEIYAQNVNSDGTLGTRPLAYWRFEEGGGTTVSDASGNGHTGTILGLSQFITAVPSSLVGGRPDLYSLNIAPNFSPPPMFDAVIVPDSPTLRPADGITVEAWVRPTNGANGPIVTKKMFDLPVNTRSFGLFLRDPYSAGRGVLFSLADTGGSETQVVGLSTGPYSNSVPPDDRWSHIAGTWDSQTQIMRLYVNFVEVASAPFAGPIGYDDDSPVLIGGENLTPGGEGMFGLSGDVDEVRIFDRALTPEEMLRISSALPPIVIVPTPAAFDTLPGLTNSDITWVAIDDGGVSSVKIEFTSNFGGSFTTLATGEPNDSVYTWAVPGINSDQCRIRVTAYDAAGDSAAAFSDMFFTIVTPVSGIDDAGVPPRLSLGPTYPNPFNPAITIKYDIPAQAQVDLTVYDVSGRAVQTLVRGVRSAGRYSVVWDGRNASGARVSSGIYFLRLESGGLTQTRKIVLLK
jgi:hypothetical protein